MCAPCFDYIVPVPFRCRSITRQLDQLSLRERRTRLEIPASMEDIRAIPRSLSLGQALRSATLPSLASTVRARRERQVLWPVRSSPLGRMYDGGFSLPPLIMMDFDHSIPAVLIQLIKPIALLPCSCCCHSVTSSSDPYLIRHGSAIKTGHVQIAAIPTKIVSMTPPKMEDERKCESADWTSSSFAATPSTDFS